MCKVDLTWSSNQTDITEAELFELATNRFDELLEQFYIRFFREDVSIFFSGMNNIQLCRLEMAPLLNKYY